MSRPIDQVEGSSPIKQGDSFKTQIRVQARVAWDGTLWPVVEVLPGTDQAALKQVAK